LIASLVASGMRTNDIEVGELHVRLCSSVEEYKVCVVFSSENGWYSRV
jgi:hypothetical protein